MDHPVSSVKRLMLYHHFDCDNIIDPYVLYQLKAYHDFGIRIVFLTNSDLPQDELKKLDYLVSETVLHGNYGFDFGAWQDWLRKNGPDAIRQYDELILANCSCYGPLFPLEEMFAEMETRDCDFWGLTGYQTDKKHPEHIQSNLQCFYPQVFLSDVFGNYWNENHDFSTFCKTIEHGEVELSQKLINAGFRSAVFCNVDNRHISWQLSFVPSFSFYAPDYLIRKFRIPFLKIKGFISSETLPFGKSGLIMDAIRDSGSAYPIRLILDHLRRVHPLSWQKDLPGTLLISEKNAPIVFKAPNLRIAAVIHVTSTTLLEEQLSFLWNMPKECTFFFSVTQRTDAEYISKKMNGYRLKITVVQPGENHFSSWIDFFRNELNNYDLVLKLHTLDTENTPELLPFEWRHFVFSTLSGSKAQVYGIINAFESECDLGILFYPVPPVLMMQNPHVFAKKHSSEDLQLLNVCCKECLPPEETGSPVFPVGGMFWYRPAALRNIIDCPQNTSAINAERILPYIAQSNGYYYRLAISTDTQARSFQIFEDRLTSSYWDENEVQIERLNQKIQQMEQSLSWKQTKPIRFFRTLFKRRME